MLEHNSVNVHSNTRHSSHYKSENRMAVSVILEIFLTVCIVKYCFLSEVCRYDKNSASYYCFTSDVMYKRNKRLVYKYTHPDLLTSKLVERKKVGLIFFSTN